MRTDVRQEASVIGLIVGLAYQGIGLIKTSGSSSTFAMATADGTVQALGLRVGWGWLSGNDLSNHLIQFVTMPPFGRRPAISSCRRRGGPAFLA